MELYYSFSVLIVITSIFYYLNLRYLKMPSSIGVMIIAMVVSIVLVFFGNRIFPDLILKFSSLMNSFDFSELLMGGILNFLLFAGGIHININDFKKERLSIITFSTVSVIISTIAVGYILYYSLQIFHFKANLIYCFLFGALISPTDPVAVLSILKNLNISRSIEIKISGESLFNDGISVVLVAVILKILEGGGQNISFSNIAILLLKEAGGGMLVGILIGYLASVAINKVKDYKASIIITLAVVMGGYLVAKSINISGPLTMVSAGLIIGNSKKMQLSTRTMKGYLGFFWELIDEILNAVLFILIGFELLLIPNVLSYWQVGIISILAVLLARYISIKIPVLIIPFKEKYSRQTIRILVWGGLRGGVSIALALSIPEIPGYEGHRNAIIAITYFVVIFSIVVQGLTINKIAQEK
ncbi:cation:proton antiporter [Apibacter adventoris]|uniref:Sodium:proton antiporter n=1 Tax=Apibacter adventoris TaxID=1679466 RepID=A0A2S8A8R3_9FLAO|nr:sodium:proton antiporter [Apibacter adventoris]PQL90965.1 sodium:proton antiporter [Apibacter adventoris]